MNWSYVNATFELVQAVLVWASVFRLSQEKRVQGVYAPTFFFSTAWAFTAIPYYWSHNDWLSALPCVVRTLGLAAWSCMFLHFKLAPAKPVVNLRSVPAGLTSSRRFDR